MRLNNMSQICHKAAKDKGFWDRDRNIGELLMLVVSELSEALEADRKGDRENFNEEIADTFIRLFDLCGGMNIDIELEISHKLYINKARPLLHGKLY